MGTAVLVSMDMRIVPASAAVSRLLRCAFDPILGDLRRANVAAFHWGLVDGKSQTIYPWDTWKKIYTAEPPLWHHDIFRADGSACRPTEVAFLKKLRCHHPHV